MVLFTLRKMADGGIHDHIGNVRNIREQIRNLFFVGFPHCIKINHSLSLHAGEALMFVNLQTWRVEKTVSSDSGAIVRV